MGGEIILVIGLITWDRVCNVCVVVLVTLYGLLIL